MRWSEIRQPQLLNHGRQMTLKRCTTCKKPKPEESFRLRKIGAQAHIKDPRVAACTECEAVRNPHGNMDKPPPLWTQPKPYEPDATDTDVQRFRRELEQRGIQRQGAG